MSLALVCCASICVCVNRCKLWISWQECLSARVSGNIKNGSGCHGYRNRGSSARSCPPLSHSHTHSHRYIYIYISCCCCCWLLVVGCWIKIWWNLAAKSDVTWKRFSVSWCRWIGDDVTCICLCIDWFTTLEVCRGDKRTQRTMTAKRTTAPHSTCECVMCMKVC